jgi:Rieske Fe-S protein
MKTDDQDLNNEGMNRRRFLILAAACAAVSNSDHASARSATDGHPEKLIDAGPLSKYSADGLYEGFHDLGFFVIRNGDKLIALSSYCTHRKCKLTAERDHTFYCECHGSTFDPGGKVTQGPATRNLPVLPTISDKGHLFVKMP